MNFLNTLTPEQIKQITIWANEKLMDILDGAHYDGDDWYTIDETLPELAGKIDINIYDWEDDNEKATIRCVAYQVVDSKTDCSEWIEIF